MNIQISSLLNSNPFLGRLFGNFEQARLYENAVLQEKARQIIPLDELKRRTRRNYNFATDQNDEFGDFLLLELLNWFKNEFFTWTDKPKCGRCGSETKFHSNVEANFEEKLALANRVENYLCENERCSNFTRFPRFNDPNKLLETKTGRCGEWANCFTLCARSLGYEVRYVLDSTDHVWTEVWSRKQKRWLHCDACENACDSPLTYERGWGKRLTHVTAFGRDHVRDVAWRYSQHHRALSKRRTQICSESSLAKVLQLMNSILLEKYASSDEYRKKELENQFIQELIEFICPRKTLKDKETQGRISGNLDWRSERGELGGAATTTMTSLNLNGQSKFGYVIVPDQSELEAGGFSLEYVSFGDFYIRKCGGGENFVRKMENFQSLIFEMENIQRKVESDWRQVYLCRRPNCRVGEVGFLVYKFETKHQKYGFEKIDVFLQWAIFDEGNVRATICYDDTCQSLLSNKTQNIDLNGCREFKIRIDLLDGGASSTFWQKSQLFRAPFDFNHCSLKFEIKLRKFV